MHDDDKENFEANARQEIVNWIESYDDEDKKKRLYALQWKIDQQLRKYTDPLAKMNKMVELFWDGFMDLHEVLLDHEEFLLHYHPDSDTPPTNDNIVPFPTKPKQGS